jgi:hypothetical protein
VELFTIQCTTCRARLKVNDESVIGDILACPKCNSMVQIIPPIGWQRSSGAAASAEKLAAWPPKVQPKASAIDPSREQTKAATVIPPAIPPVMPPALPPRPATVAAATPPPPVPMVSPSPTATSPAAPAIASQVMSGALSAAVARARQDWMLLAGGVAGGIAVGCGVWWTLAMQAPTAPSRLDEASQTSVVVAEQSPTIADTPAAEPKLAGPGAQTPAGEIQPPSAEPALDQPPADPAPVALAAEQIEDDPQSATRPLATASPAVEKDARGPTIKLDAAPAPTPTEIASDSPVASEPSAADELADETQDVSPAPSALSAGGDLAGSPRTALSKADIDERLSQALPTIEFAGVPLAKFVDFIGDFTGLSFQIDDTARNRISKDRQRLVTIKLSDTTAGDALRAALKKLGLTCDVRDGRVVITAVKQASR